MKKQVDDLWDTYNLLLEERESTVKKVADADTVTKAKTSVNSLTELDEHISIVFNEIIKLDPPVFEVPSEIVIAKKKVGRPSKKK